MHFTCLKNYVIALSFNDIKMSPPVYNLALMNKNFSYEEHLRVGAETNGRLTYNFSKFCTVLIKLYLNGIAS